jgi:hypothetical protein
MPWLRRRLTPFAAESTPIADARVCQGNTTLTSAEPAFIASPLATLLRRTDSSSSTAARSGLRPGSSSLGNQPPPSPFSRASDNHGYPARLVSLIRAEAMERTATPLPPGAWASRRAWMPCPDSGAPSRSFGRSMDRPKFLPAWAVPPNASNPVLKKSVKI